MLALAEQNRTFGYAVAASIALHALLLALKAPPMHAVPATPPEPPLVAHLVEPAPPPPAPPPALEKRPEPQPKPKPKAERKPTPRAKPPPKPPPIARQSPTLAVPPPSAPPPPLPEPQAKEAAVEPAPATPPAPSPVPSAPVPPAHVVAAPPRPDPATALAQFRGELVELAKRYKRYPPRAADNGWTGDVVVSVDIGASGKINSVRVKKSSGFDVLDAQALEMFRRAAPEVALPAALVGKPFSVDVRAIYNLSDRPG